ncbi:MAG: hypothetical protein IPK94_06235 [Saprospiraceae bacterium]|nr:hypothetical protein [Saprospiraceae bacterium]
MPYEHQSVTLPPEGWIDRYASKYFAFMTTEFIVENGKLFRTLNRGARVISNLSQNLKQNSFMVMVLTGR